MDAASTVSRPSDRAPMETRKWRIDPAQAAIVAAICWSLFALMALLVITGRTGTLDTVGLKLSRSGASLASGGPARLLEAMRDITALGGVLLRNLFAASAVIALLLLRLRREALVLAGTVLGGWLFNSVIKSLVARDRPTLVPHLVEAGGHSFPSGHSFNSAVVFLATALVFSAMTPRRPIRWTIIGAAVLLTWMIAYSRVWLGVHYPSDVIAGWLGGAGWVFMAAAVLDRPARRPAGRMAR